MGRWSQARRRGGGGLTQPLPELMWAPGEGDWELDADGDYLLATLSASFPVGSDSWQTRSKPDGAPSWVLQDATSAGTITVSEDVGILTWEVQARYCIEEPFEGVSEWSTVKTWPV